MEGYSLPGGHIEPGESIVDAVVREMKEETGLTIKSPRLCGVKQFHLVDDFEELIEVMLSDTLTEFQYIVKNAEWIVVKK